MASWNNFQAKQNVTLGNCMTDYYHVNTVIHFHVNSFHQLSYFEFAVYFQ